MPFFSLHIHVAGDAVLLAPHQERHQPAAGRGDLQPVEPCTEPAVAQVAALLERPERSGAIVRNLPELRCPVARVPPQHQVLRARIAVERRPHRAAVEHQMPAPATLQRSVRVRPDEHVVRVHLDDLADRLVGEVLAVSLPVVARAAVRDEHARRAGRLDRDRQRQRRDPREPARPLQTFRAPGRRAPERVGEPARGERRIAPDPHPQKVVVVAEHHRPAQGVDPLEHLGALRTAVDHVAVHDHELRLDRLQILDHGLQRRQVAVNVGEHGDAAHVQRATFRHAHRRSSVAARACAASAASSALRIVLSGAGRPVQASNATAP